MYMIFLASYSTRTYLKRHPRSVQDWEEPTRQLFTRLTLDTPPEPAIRSGDGVAELLGVVQCKVSAVLRSYDCQGTQKILYNFSLRSGFETSTICVVTSAICTSLHRGTTRCQFVWLHAVDLRRESGDRDRIEFQGYFFATSFFGD